MRVVAGPILASVVLVGTLGAVHGVFTDRWGPSGQLEQALAALDRVPAAVGDWSGEDVAYEPEDMARAGIKGCVFRRYKNARTREAVSVLLVCGRGGPISVHTPDVCYAGAGYRQVGDERTREVEVGAEARVPFRVARFAPPGGVSPTQLETYWAWSRDGRVWEAPQNPRLTLARSAALYKLYVTREFTPGARAEAADPCQTFLRLALSQFGLAVAGR
jgi:hypothetical protein